MGKFGRTFGQQTKKQINAKKRGVLKILVNVKAVSCLSGADVFLKQTYTNVTFWVETRPAHEAK